MTDLAKLIERVEALQGPSDTVDYELTQLVDPGAVRYSSAHLHYTASVDDALGLADRILPLRDHDYVRTNGRHRFSLALPGSGVFDVQAYGPTAPLAILAALLRALSARSP